MNDNWNDNPYALMARIKGQLHVSRFKRISQYFPNHTDSLDLWREQVLNRCQMLYYPSRELAIYQSAVSSATELASGIAKSYELRDLHGYIYSFGVYKDRTPLEIVKGLANQLWGKGHILQIQTSTKSDPFAYALGEESVTTDTSDVPSINIGRFVEFDIFHSLDHDFKLQDDACLNSLSSVNDEPSQLNPAFYCTPFLRLIDISVHNAFVLYKMSHSELENDFQQFRQQVVQKIFLQYDSNVEIMPFCSHSPTKLMSPRKPCVVCATRGIKRRRTSFYCTSCVTHPSLCFLSKRNCFAEWHGRITEV